MGKRAKIQGYKTAFSFWGAVMKEEKGFELRIRGLKWSEIADQLGYPSPNTAYKSVLAWADKEGLELPIITNHRLEMAQKAYQIKSKSRLSWKKVAEKVGYSSPDCAFRGAKRWAMKNDYPWPIAGFLSQGEIGWIEAKEGASWEEIRLMMGEYSLFHVKERSRKWARRHGKEWPPKPEMILFDWKNYANPLCVCCDGKGVKKDKPCPACFPPLEQ